MTHHHLSVRDIILLLIECRPPRLYECFWCHYFRTKNIITVFFLPVYFCRLGVVMICREPPSLLATYYGSVVLGMHARSSQILLSLGKF